MQPHKGKSDNHHNRNSLPGVIAKVYLLGGDTETDLNLGRLKESDYLVGKREFPEVLGVKP